jgi:regulator of sigma E protease
MTAILATIIVLGVLIFVHELGHFWAAKAVGIEVQRFSIGLGPRVWGFRRGETEYVLSAIPLGGYVKMAGMADEVADKIEGGAVPGEEGAQSDPSRAFDSKPIWARTLVISAGVIMNMLFALLVFVGVAGAWGVGELDTNRVHAVRGELLPPGASPLASMAPGSRIESVGGRAVEHWGDIRDAFLELPAGGAEVVLRAPDAVLSVQLPADAAERARIPQALEPWLEPRISALTPGGAAERGGLQAGDRLEAVDGEPVTSWSRFVELIQARPATRTEITLRRGDQVLVRAVTPESSAGTDPTTGEAREIGVVGIYPDTPTVSVRVSLPEAVRSGARETWAVTTFIAGSLKQLITGQVSPRNLGSIVTIGQASGEAADAGLVYFLRFMALFSVNLAVLNLLPIPILDGGHLVFLGVEAIRGRALSVEQRMRWSQVGFLIVVGIMVLALSNDFIRILGL